MNNSSASFRYFRSLWDQASMLTKIRVFVILRLAVMKQKWLCGYDNPQSHNHRDAIVFLTVDVSDNDTCTKEENQQLIT